MTIRLSYDEVLMLIDALDQRFAGHQYAPPDAQKRYEVLVSKLHNIRRDLNTAHINEAKAQLEGLGWKILPSGDGDGT